MTSTVQCTCTGPHFHATTAAAFQDRLYGRGRRVFTLSAKGEARCTVCSSTHRIVVDHHPRKKGGGGNGGRAKTFTASPPAMGWPGGLPENNGYKHIT